MGREIKFTACACTGCEQTKPEAEVVWDVGYWRTDNSKREVGFLLGSEVSYYVGKEKIVTTQSSTTCPQCAADALTDGSIEALRIRWSNLEPKWLYQDTDAWIRRYLLFQRKNSR